MNQELKEKLHYYLPHGLKVAQPRCGKIEVYDFYGIKYSKTVKEWSVFIDDSRHGDYQQVYLKGVCPLFRPLSSLTKEIVVSSYNDGKPFVPIDHIYSKCGLDNVQYVEHCLTTHDFLNIPFYIFERLFQWHFWIGDQNLFDTGEIIRIEG